MWIHSLQAQSLINIDFGVGEESRRVGQAAAGFHSQDFWNLYRHYEPRYEPGAPMVPDGTMSSLRYSDGRPSSVDVEVSNAPGVWGNATGDPMIDSFVFSQNREPISIVLRGLPQGHYQVFLYGYASADVEPAQHTSFNILSGVQSYGPRSSLDFGDWHSDDPWNEGRQYCVFRNVRVEEQTPLILKASASGIPIVNGIQILSRGTSPPDWQPKEAKTSEEVVAKLLMPRIDYRGSLTGKGWQGRAELTVKSITTNIVTAPLFSPEVAVKAQPLPDGVFLHQNDSSSYITVLKPGQYQLAFDLTVAASHHGLWNSVRFDGPPTAINRLEFHPISEQTELEFLTNSGWSRIGPSSPNGTDVPSDLLSRSCILDHPRLVAFKWKENLHGKENTPMWRATASSEVDLNPGLAQWKTHWNIDVERGGLEEFTISLPTELNPLKLGGEGVVDWELLHEEEAKAIRVYLADPISDSWSFNLVSEQVLESTLVPLPFEAPKLLEAQRESGSILFRSSHMDLRIHTQVAMHQINAPADSLMAFRYHEKVCSIEALVQERKPRVTVSERIGVTLSETLLSSRHDLSLSVDQASLHHLRFELPESMAVNEVTGEHVQEWSVRNGYLELSFNTALLGTAKIGIVIEKLVAEETEQLALTPLRIENADQVQTVLGIHNAPGIVSQTSSADHLRPVTIEVWEGSENPPQMAYETEQTDWKLVLDIRRPTSRVVADVFQVLTIGEGKAGGSATVRFAIFNQGMREIRLRLPDHWVNLEFTGPHVRDRKQEEGEWIIGLHEKVWDGYTLVISYEFSFDHSNASLPIRVPTLAGAYRQTGHVAVISHPSVELKLNAVTPSLRVIDPLDLPRFGRSLLTRPAVLAFEYSTAGPHGVDLKVGRHLSMEGLEAVVDRAAFTTVLTDSAEMLTKGTYMIKNHSRRYQRLQLPKGSTLWSCHVDGTSTKVEQHDDWLMIAIPQHTNQDATITVEVVYKEANPEMGSWIPKSFVLEAPQTDIPSTYAEWRLFAPASLRLSHFQGNMKAAPGVIYDLREAWRLYADVYAGILKRGMTLLTFLLILGGGISLLALAKRVRGWNGFINAAILAMVLLILAGMLLPALSKAKSKAQTIKTANNLKNIGLAARIYETDHGRFPVDFSEMRNELATEKILVDPVTGKQLIYVGAGKSSDHPDSILAYSPLYNGGRRMVAMTDGSVRSMGQREFQTLLEADITLLAQLSTGAGPEPSRAPLRQEGDPNLPPNTGARNATNDSSGHSTQFSGALDERLATGTLRSILIDIPETGISYQFSKTLNHGDAPLILRMNMMNGKVYRGFLRGAYACLFLAGVLLAWLEWHKTRPRAWLLTMGIIIGITSVIGFLIMMRLLHYVLMFGTPILLLAALLTAIKPIHGWYSRIGKHHASKAANLSITLFLLLKGLTVTPLQAATTDSNMKKAELPSVTLLSARYEGVAAENSVTLQAQYQLNCRTPMSTLLLFKQGVAIDDFQVAQGQAQLARQKEGIELLIEETGETHVTMQLYIKIDSVGAYQEFNPSLPTAMSSELYLKLSEPEAQVEAPSASSLTTQKVPEGLWIEAVYGPSQSPQFKWISRKQSAKDRNPNFSVNSTSLLRFQDGFVHLKSEFRCQMIQGQLRSIPIQIPNGYDVVSVSGRGIDHWEISSPPPKQTLMINLASPLTDQIILDLELTNPMKNMPMEMTLSVPSFEQANREVGWLALEHFEEHDLIIHSLEKWRRVDKPELPELNLVNPENLSHTFRFSQPGGGATIRLSPTVPKLDAKVWNDYSVTAQGLKMNASVKLEIQNSGLFQLDFGLPKNLTLDQVKGEGIQQWQVLDSAQGQILEIEFSQRILGEYALQMEMHQTWDALPDRLEFHQLRVFQTEKYACWLLVRSEPGIALISTQRQGMVEISPDKVRSPHSNLTDPKLAFRSTQTDTDQAPRFITTEMRRLDPWITAEMTHRHVFHESFVEGVTTIRYEVQDAPITKVQIQVPESFKNVHVTGDDVLSHQPESNETWVIKFRRPILNELEIHIQWERDLALTSEGVEIPVECIRAMNVKRETGILLASVRPPLQITATQSSGSLTKLSPRGAAQAMTESSKLQEAQRNYEIALAYQYLQPDFEMTWQLVRNRDALLLDALADRVSFTTVVAEDGQLIARAAYTIRNRGKRHLLLDLPNRTTPWSVFVSDQSIRPGVDGNRLLIPIEGFGAQDSVQKVDVIYVGKVNFPLTHGFLALESPSIDVPLKEITWEILLPGGYRYESHATDLKQQSATEFVEEDFSSLEYRRQDVERRAETRKGSLDTLLKARDALSVGSVGKAAQMLSVEKQKGYQGEMANTRMQEIESELTQVQASNLLEAEKSFILSNRGRYTTQHSAPIGERIADENRMADQYAQRQWRKVHDAQRFSDSPPEPMRINLPTRGLRTTFTKPLQAEVGRPLQLRIEATHEARTGHWSRWFTTGLLVISIHGGILWLSAKRTRPQAPTL